LSSHFTKFSELFSKIFAAAPFVENPMRIPRVYTRSPHLFAAKLAESAGLFANIGI
jgi:hypothetical protein